MPPARVAGTQTEMVRMTAAPPISDIRPAHGWAALNLRELWQYRELLSILVWRDLKVRYKQTALGVAWIVLQPLTTTLIFSLIFGQLVHVPSGDLPYPVFVLAALVPWTYFATTLTRSSTSLVQNAHLITKVYFPRLMIPLAGTINGLADLAIACVSLMLLMLFFGLLPSSSILLAPFFLMLVFALALGASLWLAACHVHYRDIDHLLPFMLQVWMYASPVVYPSSLIPERWQPLYFLNPMAGAVEGFRWAVTGHGQAPGITLVPSAIAVLAILASGAIFFRRTERTFADVV